MTDTNDLRIYGKKQKFGRLQREIKQHPQNCYKRQKKLLELQDMIFSRDRI